MFKYKYTCISTCIQHALEPGFNCIPTRVQPVFFKIPRNPIPLHLMKILVPLLFPFAVLYDVVTSLRNRLFDTGRRPSIEFDVPVVGVGNLAVGGTGKTPMTEYLVRLLAGEFHTATLSRGYGRKSRGMRIAGPEDTSETVGDEPLQLYRKFKDKVVVAVGEERVFAIPLILHTHPKTNLILMDDAFQHRSVRPAFQILLTTYDRPFTEDFLLPAGRLRESRRGASRADVIVVTKCPSSISDDDMIAMERAIRRYTDKAVFFSRIGYGDLRTTDDAAPYKPEKIVLVTGIANPTPLEAYMRGAYHLVKHFSFADHHVYSELEMRNICQMALESGAAVVTTEKDVVKLNPEIFRASSVTLYHIPIEMQFIRDGKEFDEMVLNAVRTYDR